VTWCKRYVNYLTTWREHRQIIKQLNKLDEHQLDDIGLTRGDIDDLIWLKEDKQKKGEK